MSTIAAKGPLLRSDDSASQQVTTIELFFDLVYVFAIIQLSLRLSEHLTVRNAVETAILLLAVWQAWVNTTWLTTWFDPRKDAVRSALIAIMFGSLIISTAIPTAFGHRAVPFAVTIAALAVGRNLFAIANLQRDPPLRRNYQRIFVWAGTAGLLWIGGALLHGDGRLAVWLLALAVEYTGPAVGFATPRLGRSTTDDWATIAGGHLAERCELFILIALGESILATGRTLAELRIDTRTAAALVAAFLVSVGLWWIYFDRVAEDAGDEIEESDDPGRLGRSAYTYFHVPMVAGIIVIAVGDKLVISHPSGVTGGIEAAAILGGPALFLMGHTLFKVAAFGVLSIARIVAIALLGGLATLHGVLSPLALTVGSLSAIVVVAVWDRYAHRETPEGIALSATAD